MECNFYDELVKQYDKDKLSHVFLVETNNVELCKKDILNFLKLINCSGNFSLNCTLDCNICKLIDIGNLPNLIFISPDGASIKKEQLLELMEKYDKKPVYSKYNSYIIEQADTLTLSAANSILKFLEEPNDFIIGFLITSNKENIIDTIKSRCQLFKAYYDSNDCIDEKLVQDSIYYLDEIFNNTSILINREFILSNYATRVEINKLFQCILKIYLDYINNNYFPGNKNILKDFSLDILRNDVNILYEVLNLIQFNVNLDLILDKFVIEMRRSHA
jgi:hypothetical protein